jgi:hypothetical protein
MAAGGDPKWVGAFTSSAGEGQAPGVKSGAPAGTVVAGAKKGLMPPPPDDVEEEGSHVARVTHLVRVLKDTGDMSASLASYLCAAPYPLTLLEAKRGEPLHGLLARPDVGGWQCFLPRTFSASLGIKLLLNNRSVELESAA